MHALVPGGGPALDGIDWIESKHPKHRRRKKPYLIDVIALGRAFRDHYLAALEKLLRQGKLKVGDGAREWSKRKRSELFEKLGQRDWNVFVEGPPNGKSNPRQVIKYLARYLTGGPLADRRLIEVTKRDVTFWARPKRSQGKKRNGMHRSEPFTISGRQFVQRWSLHILPKNFVRSRSYGGYHHLRRAGYLENCRKLLGIEGDAPTSQSADHDHTSEEDQTPKCPRCKSAMRLLHSAPRPSWKHVFEVEIYRSPSIYSPILHLATSRAPPCSL